MRLRMRSRRERERERETATTRAGELAREPPSARGGIDSPAIFQNWRCALLSRFRSSAPAARPRPASAHPSRRTLLKLKTMSSSHTFEKYWSSSSTNRWIVCAEQTRASDGHTRIIVAADARACRHHSRQPRRQPQRSRAAPLRAHRVRRPKPSVSRRSRVACRHVTPPRAASRPPSPRLKHTIRRARAPTSR